MFPISLITWFLLIVIAVSDTKYHKIPNVILVLILVYQSLLYINIESQLLFLSLLACIVSFVLALLLFFLGVLSPGDVKFIGVVGFILGLEHLSFGLAWVVLGVGLTAIFYLMYNVSFLGLSNPIYIVFDKDLRTKANSISGKSNTDRYQQMLTMPFAPGAVIGIALYSYLYI
ncbi:hypothetical protein BCT05_07935 [Vibrio breoganii]|nr:hypothetical protein BCU21_01940 [Vibrio breoganii]PMK51848.1 hypothetical protein BCT97_01270 [Vibrio breoganii]PMO27009.1 hypothetical protein BCT13_03900 [Vibrio breoganii]PMO28535.1 hypothetical protein BCT14_09420 [Vibrio breoganii]PMO66952.1 hypothetical protein BCT05_07935 [Vibrio breoganii]